MKIPASSRSTAYFNSRTHGKHCTAQNTWPSRSFQFPHTRETSGVIFGQLPVLFQFPHTRETLRRLGFHPVDIVFNSRTHGKHWSMSLSTASPTVSIPAHTGNIHGGMPSGEPSMFQFPHTRETFRNVRRGVQRAVSIPAHTGNMFPRARSSAGCFFNSRTHGKHYMNKNELNGIMFQFPHTRETFVLSLSCCRLLDFNSRTHGKHLLRKYHTHGPGFNSRTHGKHPIALTWSAPALFQFPHTRETSST